MRKLRDAFVETDEDGSGDISKDEFDILMGKYTELTCAPSSSPSVFILARRSLFLFLLSAPLTLPLIVFSLRF